MFIIYTRKSTDDADNQKNSLEYQERICNEHAARHGLAVANHSVEGVMKNGLIAESHSAYKASPLQLSGAGLVEYQIERPKFMRMISWLMKGKYDGVIVLSWDRISRNEQSDMIVKELIDKHNITFHFVHGQYDHGTSAGALHRDIDGMFARHYSRVISEKIRFALQKLRQDGHFPHRAPLGYLDEGSDRKIFDPARAPIVKRLFELCGTEEWSVNELCRWARKQGLTGKPRRRQRTSGEIMHGQVAEEKVEHPVGPSQIHGMLTNPFYIGKIRHKGDLFDGAHSPLIDVQLFYRVQQVLRSRCVSLYNADVPFFSYRGLFRCTCGRGYTPYRKKGHVYYTSKCKDNCTNRTRNISEEVLVDTIQSILDQIHFSDEELQALEAGAKSGLQNIATKRDAAVEDLHRERRKTLKDLDYLRENRIVLLRERVMKPEEWREESEKCLQKLKELDASLGAYSESEKEMVDFLLAFSELMKTASGLYEQATDQEKRQLAHMVFSELTLNDGELASYKAKPPFDILLNRQPILFGGADSVFSELQGIFTSLKEADRNIHLLDVLRQFVTSVQVRGNG